MYLIIDRDDKTKFRLVKNYRNASIPEVGKFDVYCGKKGLNKGVKVAEKRRNKKTVDVLVEE